jgi:hypothetical protein
MDCIVRLFQAVKAGDTQRAKSLIDDGAALDELSEGGSALCWAARGGHADLVDILLRAGASRHIGRGPGYWAYNSPFGKQNDVLAVTRALPELDELWQAGGLPSGRWDNIVMTELKVKEFEGVALAAASSISKVGLSAAYILKERYFSEMILENPQIEKYRSGCDYALYRNIEAPADGGIYDQGAACFFSFGAEILAQLAVTAPFVRELAPSQKIASTLVRGAMSQLGFAHYELRRLMDDQRIKRAGDAMEIFHYFESPTSDHNITEIAFVIKNPA